MGDRALVSQEEFGPDPEAIAVELDPDLIRMVAEIDERPGLLCGATVGGDHQPGAVSR
jgi:hypothetical protein